LVYEEGEEMNESKLLIYLADLAHDYQKMRQYVPLSVGYVAAYANSLYGDRVEIKLFKSPDKLLDALDEKQPDLLGLSNYTWNLELSSFVGRHAKTLYPDLPLIMGGPNIGTDLNEIEEFLIEHGFVDVYCTYGGERPAAEIIKTLLDLPETDRTGTRLRKQSIDRCCALVDNAIQGNTKNETLTELDFIPSPYTTHLLDEFLDQGMIPMFETNRGCPYSCSYCFWGVDALNKLTKFGLDRVFAELDYVAQYGVDFTELYFADANFGILKRDVEIARHIRKLYDAEKSFSSVIVYWSKSAQPHMVDIGMALGHLTTTYIAFQSLDEAVLGAMKRKNINTEKLLHLITSLKKYTHTPQTDILLGSPEETFDSHLDSLDKALDFGIFKINGGEIRMLPGTDMAKPKTREKYGIKTKYRLFEGGIGIYRNNLVYELEETIRATNAMTEKEMIELRILRALFFGSVTLGENWPLIAYLTHHQVRFTRVLVDLIARGRNNPIFKKSLDWLQHEAENEFFDSPGAIAEHIAQLEVYGDLFGEKAFMKLNFGFTARLILNDDEYNAYFNEMKAVLIEHTSEFSTPEIIEDILTVCKSRNYLRQYLHGKSDVTIGLSLDLASVDALQDCNYMPAQQTTNQSVQTLLSMDPVTAGQIRQRVDQYKDQLNPFTVSQIMQMFWGRCHLEPAGKLIKAEITETERTTGFVIAPASAQGAKNKNLTPTAV